MEDFISYFFFYIIIFTCIMVASRKFGFVDKTNLRKIHSFETINTGGISIYLYLILLIYSFEFNNDIESVILLGMFVIIGGFIDDQINLTPISKFLFIIFPALYLIVHLDYEVKHLGYIKNYGALYLGYFSFPFTILAVGLLTNAINYIDGIDGLLIKFCLITFFYFAFLTNDSQIFLMTIFISIPLIFNLFFNLQNFNQKLKIFMGDGGSLFFGFLLSFYTIILQTRFGIHPAYLIWPFCYPVFDFLYVTGLRIYKKISIFTPDKNHLHQVLFYSFKKNHFKTSISISSINICIIFIGYNIAKQSALYSYCTFFIFFLIYIFFRIKFFK